MPKTSPKEERSQFDCFSDAKLQQNLDKNRYRDVMPYNYNRVLLPRQTHMDSDYINASHVKGASSDEEYIVCQGPLENTSADFWRMVFTFKVGTIVMLARTTENGMPKVFPYFSETRKASVSFGPFTIKTLEVQEHRDWVQRLFEVNYAQNDGTELLTRDVSHLQYTGWPDHGVPKDTTTFLDFLQGYRNLDPQGRLCSAVHCSAGIGRAGTFILINKCLDICVREGLVDVHAELVHLRHERPNAVQKAAQYVFAHKVIAEWLASHANSVGLGLGAKDWAFLKSLSAGKETSFDPGLPGRRLLAVYAAELAVNAQQIFIGVFNDTIIMSRPTESDSIESADAGSGRPHVLITRPCPRDKAMAEEVKAEWDTAGVRLALAGGKVVVVEMRSMEDQAGLLRLIHDRSQATSTANLVGASLLAPSRTPLAVVDLLHLPDPYSMDGVSVLEREFTACPRYFPSRIERRLPRPPPQPQPGPSTMPLKIAGVAHGPVYDYATLGSGGFAGHLRQGHLETVAEVPGLLPGMVNTTGVRATGEPELAEFDHGYLSIIDGPCEADPQSQQTPQRASSQSVRSRREDINVADSIALDVMRLQQRRMSATAQPLSRGYIAADVADTSIDAASARLMRQDNQKMQPSDSVRDLLAQLKEIGGAEPAGPRQRAVRDQWPGGGGGAGDVRLPGAVYGSEERSPVLPPPQAMLPGIYAEVHSGDLDDGHADTRPAAEMSLRDVYGVTPGTDFAGNETPETVETLLHELRRLSSDGGGDAIGTGDALFLKRDRRVPPNLLPVPAPATAAPQGLRFDEDGKKASIGGLELVGGAANRLLQRRILTSTSKPERSPNGYTPSIASAQTTVCTFLGNCQCPNCVTSRA